ncbi:MAG: PEGA domain-containing protein [Polyangiaceae bacterium]
MRSIQAMFSAICVLHAASGRAEAPAAPKAAPAPALVFDSGSGTDADEAGKARGRALYEQGAAAYAEGRYLKAVEAFLDAHRAYPTPQLVYNVGKAYDRAGSAPAALSYYREYLRHLPEATDHAEVSARISELQSSLAERGVQQLSVLSEPALATLSIDGTPVGVTPWTGETWPGKHRVRLELSGRKAVDGLVEVAPHRADDFRFMLEPAPVEPRRAPELARRAPETANAPSALTWIVLGAGTAALGTALFVEMANQDREGVSRTGAFFGGAGLSACALGGVLLYVDFHAAPETHGAQSGRVLGASWQGSF